MSKQVLDISQMQHLKELGVDISRASTSWYRVLITGSDTVVTDWFPVFGTLSVCAPTMRYETMPTFTLQDILDLLPDSIKDVDGYENDLSIDKFDKIWYVSYSLSDEFEPMQDFDKEELIDAAYEMLCWCIENGYVETNKQ